MAVRYRGGIAFSPGVESVSPLPNYFQITPVCCLPDGLIKGTVFGRLRRGWINWPRGIKTEALFRWIFLVGLLVKEKNQ